MTDENKRARNIKWPLLVVSAFAAGGGLTLLGSDNFNAGKLLNEIKNGKECVIKGNINQEGKKIYHMPGQTYYDKTEINTRAGEKWFCEEEEAIQAGWRKAKI